MWTFILMLALVWLTYSGVKQANRSADQKLVNWTNKLQAQHDERVGHWSRELDSARMPEYREYCQQQIDQWYWTSPVGQQELTRLRAEVANKLAQDPGIV